MIQHYPLAEKIGKTLASKQAAVALRDLLVQSKVPLVLDFSGVDLVAEPFVQIAFGEAAKTLGRERFHLQVSMKNLSLKDRTLIFSVLEASFQE